MLSCVRDEAVAAEVDGEESKAADDEKEEELEADGEGEGDDEEEEAGESLRGS